MAPLWLTAVAAGSVETIPPIPVPKFDFLEITAKHTEHSLSPFSQRRRQRRRRQRKRSRRQNNKRFIYVSITYWGSQQREWINPVTQGATLLLLVYIVCRNLPF